MAVHGAMRRGDETLLVVARGGDRGPCNVSEMSPPCVICRQLSFAFARASGYGSAERGSSSNPEEHMIGRLCSCIAVGLLLAAGPVLGQAKARATTPEIPFDSVNFIKTMPPGLYMGEAIGVATNSKGNVFVITRSGESKVFEFDRNGNFVKEFGRGSYGYGFAHAVRVDKDDNVWSVDEGSNVILKYARSTRLTASS
jgi:hypothetical protein